MKKGKIVRAMKIAMTTAMAAALTTGCVDYMPDMTQEQTDLIAEYAANLLLKYSPNYDYKIVDVQETEETVEMIEETVEESSEINEEQTKQENEQTKEEQIQETDEETNETLAPQDAKIAEFLNVEDFEIEYASYEITNAYPKETSGFAVSAPEGKKLLIIHYNVSNVSDDKETCELLEKEAAVYVNINATGYRETMSTLLVNDFTSYVEELDSKETKDVVSVIAIPEESDEIESLTLQIRFAGDEITVKVK